MMKDLQLSVTKDQLHHYAKWHLKWLYGEMMTAEDMDKFHTDLGLLTYFIECGFEAGFRTDNKPN